MYTTTDSLMYMYNNTLLVYPDPQGVSVTVECIAMIGGVSYNQYVIIHRMIALQSITIRFPCIFL